MTVQPSVFVGRKQYVLLRARHFRRCIVLCLPHWHRICHDCSVQVQPSMARELFAAGFVSCWGELDEGLKDQLVRSLEAALASPTIPPDIVTNLLNLAEFMEHDEKKLPLDSR